MNTYISKGFALLLLTMAITQFLTLSFFNHIIMSYLTPLGGGGPLTMFVLPITVAIVGLEGLAALALLVMDSQNVMRRPLIIAGALVMVLWCVLILSALLRNHPMPHVGFFGGKLRQPLNWFAFVQAVFFMIWGYVVVQNEAPDA